MNARYKRAISNLLFKLSFQKNIKGEKYGFAKLLLPATHTRTGKNRFIVRSAAVSSSEVDKIP